MNREVCGICWCPYDDNGACGCKPQTGVSMNREDIIRMAREAGCHEASHPMNPWSVTQEALERFAALVAALVAAAEREAIIQAMPGGHSVDPQWVCDMIRARGNK